MEEQNTITISRELYNEFIRNEEKIAVVKRMYESGNYVSTDDIKTALGIN